MNKKTINIVILEPSQIVYEGTSNILSKSGSYLKLFRIDNCHDIEKLYLSEKLSIAIINPVQIQNRTKEFIAVKKSLPEVFWIALVYTIIDHQLLMLFDKVIFITDTQETILDIVDKLIERDNHSQPVEQEQLSEREIEVLKLIVAGLSNKEIADKLFISIHTVISHRKNISHKTSIKSQSGLTIYAISNKIIRLEDYKTWK